MSNWLKKMFCGKNCKCHCEEKPPVPPVQNTPNMNASAEVKPTPESTETPGQQM